MNLDMFALMVFGFLFAVFVAGVVTLLWLCQKVNRQSEEIRWIDDRARILSERLVELRRDKKPASSCCSGE